MTEDLQNVTVTLAEQTGTSRFAAQTPQRPLLAIVLGGPLAVIFVTLFGAIWLTLSNIFIDVDPAAATTTPFMIALGMTFVLTALNIVVFFATVPITWAVMGLAMLALKAHKKYYSPRFFRLMGVVLTPLAIALVMLTGMENANVGQQIFGKLLGAILVGVPAGIVLMSAVWRILYWKKPIIA